MDKLYNFIDNLKKFNKDIQNDNKIYEYVNYSDFIDSLKLTKLTNNKEIREYDFISLQKIL